MPVSFFFFFFVPIEEVACQPNRLLLRPAADDDIRNSGRRVRPWFRGVGAVRVGSRRVVARELGISRQLAR
ncbi:hypothetical protein GGS23DRAFT_574617 [Durotheca rogersii]|uniref:uncharacterized protein n=1 Tax=Durotheca rogersii TaxID=419775 RepID=UPI00221EF755|nr:uncharacterized protein GGS23DRAFT_574617 [Durotheca rogersii]KAI5861722.1 hypothetical protein GGS23DRAFT_574617 [Durotheca rogersii]